MIIDIVFIAGLVGMIIFGYKKGFIQVVSNVVKLILAFILAYIFARAAGQFIKNSTSIGTKISNSIERVSTQYINKEKVDNSINSVITTVEDAVKADMTQDKVRVTSKLSEYIFTGIGFVAVYVIVRIALWIATMILDSVFELPVLRLFNKTGGVIAAIILFILEFSIF